MADSQVTSAVREFNHGQIASAIKIDKRSVERRAIREGWGFREVTGRGGKRRMYALHNLPVDVRRAINLVGAISAANSAAHAAGASIGRKLALAESIDSTAQQRQREAGTARAAGLTDNARARMEAKLDLLARLDQFAQHHSLGICAAVESFCAAYRAGEIYVSVQIRHLVGSDVSPATVRRWRQTLRTQGAAGLAGDYGNRSGSGLIDSQPELRDFVLGLLTDKPHLSGKNLHRAVCARFGQSSLKLPTGRSVSRWLATFKTDNAQLYTAIANPDAWKNRYMSAFGSASEDVHRLNQRWEFDSTPADVMLTDGRHTIVQIVDIWSRRRLFYVSKTSSGAAVCQAIRRAILAWGLPEQAKIDNGKDYVSERVQRVFQSIGTEVQVSPPFSPWKKPHVESGFKTFLHGIFEMLSGYLGHDVADQQAIRASKSFAERMFKKNEVVDIRLSAAELQTFCDRWCRDLYEHEGLEAENWPRGMSVFQRVASWRGEVRRITDERVLDLLLAEAPDGTGGRTVSKKGIRVDRLTYIAPELHGMVGERVRVLYDERDAGRIVVYHNEAYCCIAECPEILGISRAEIAAEANAQRKAGIAAQRAELQRLKRKANTRDIAFEILDAKARENAALTALPLAENVLHLTPAIEAAQEAAEALDQSIATRQITQDDVDAQDRANARDEAARIARGDTAKERFARSLELMLVPEPERSPFDQRWLDSFSDSPEFQGAWMMFESFGPARLGHDEKFSVLLPDGSLHDRYQATLRRNRDNKLQGV